MNSGSDMFLGTDTAVHTHAHNANSDLSYNSSLFTFDIVSHEILLSKLKQPSNNGCFSYHYLFLTGFILFLVDRSLIYKVDGQMAAVCYINWGAMQGSAFRPTLCIIMKSDDLLPNSTNSVHLKYADSTNFVVPENTDFALVGYCADINHWVDNRIVTEAIHHFLLFSTCRVAVTTSVLMLWVVGVSFSIWLLFDGYILWTA